MRSCRMVYLLIFVVIVDAIGADALATSRPWWSPAKRTAFVVATEEPAVNISPKVAPYRANANLSNVRNAKYFLNGDNVRFTQTQKALLVKNGFVVVPATHPEFFPLYEQNAYRQTPSFITTDSLLHNYHLLFDFLLEKLEETQLARIIKLLSTVMHQASLDQYQALKKSPWEEAARRNAGFFAVGSMLLNPGLSVPSIVQREVNEELLLMREHAGIAESPLMHIKEDYSQYVPRGHYTKSEQLKAYFSAMMWYGRMKFNLRDEVAMRSAVLMTIALHDPANRTSWSRINDVVDFFVGEAVGLTADELMPLLQRVYGGSPTREMLVRDNNKFTELVDTLPRKKEFRFVGQRRVLDTDIFTQLVANEVPGRMLPSGLDIPAAMGSEEALHILQSMGTTKYPNYSANMAMLRVEINLRQPETCPKNLYCMWLHVLQSLTTEKRDGYPMFMKNRSWLRKELTTYLGSWAELKHDTILYAEQVYAEGGGEEGAEQDDRGYVEPNPLLYARLGYLVRLTREGLEARKLLDNDDRESLRHLEHLAASLKTIAEKELTNTPRTKSEYDLIRAYGESLEHLWLNANQDIAGFDLMTAVDQNPAALIADVATDPVSGKALEVGTGRIFEIYVVVPLPGGLRIARGGVYSYYEFPWPMSDRLTDVAWRKLLDSDKTPSLPDWTSTVVGK